MDITCLYYQQLQKDHCAFIDFGKAGDEINRFNQWSKLTCKELRPRMTDCIKKVYRVPNFV